MFLGGLELKLLNLTYISKRFIPFLLNTTDNTILSSPINALKHKCCLQVYHLLSQTGCTLHLIPKPPPWSAGRSGLSWITQRLMHNTRKNIIGQIVDKRDWFIGATTISGFCPLGLGCMNKIIHLARIKWLVVVDACTTQIFWLSGFKLVIYCLSKLGV